ncbi:MAG: hypothetical protein BRC23_02105 [Parcubacteria group bacterium SW_4_49_11]|nr:MAG: hypothetical protein BRC23_02105 [Parcubacteria group bacterium SW_4_49_11]
MIAAINSKKTILFVIGIFLALVGLWGNVAEGENSKNNARMRYKIQFKDSLNIQNTVSFLKRKNMDSPVELHYRYGPIQGGYRVKGELKEGIEKFKEEHKDFLSTAIKSNAQRISESSNKKLERLQANLKSAKRQTRKKGLQIDSLKVSNALSSSEIQDLKSRRGVKEVQYLKSKQAQNIKERSRTSDVSTSSLYNESWAPYTGFSLVNREETYQTFYFNNQVFDGDDTYEHETIVYEIDFANYDGYWSSNLPNAYYDTPFSDTYDIFAVGSSTASSLVTHTEYYTYMSLAPQSQPIVQVDIKGQKGHRIPSWCYSTWCIFADDTTGALSRNFNAPYQGSWTY